MAVQWSFLTGQGLNSPPSKLEEVQIVVTWDRLYVESLTDAPPKCCPTMFLSSNPVVKHFFSYCSKRAEHCIRLRKDIVSALGISQFQCVLIDVCVCVLFFFILTGAMFSSGCTECHRPWCCLLVLNAPLDLRLISSNPPHAESLLQGIIQP